MFKYTTPVFHKPCKDRTNTYTIFEYFRVSTLILMTKILVYNGYSYNGKDQRNCVLIVYT